MFSIVQQQQVLMFICLLHLLQKQQILCHVSLSTTTTRTTTTTMNTQADDDDNRGGNDNSATVGLSTLAKLVTMMGSNKRKSYNDISETATSSSSSSTSLSSSSGRKSLTRYATKILNVQANCTRDLLEMHIEINKNFRGLLYAEDFPLECRARGNDGRHITLRIPTSGCGVRAEPLNDDSMEYSVRVMLQMEQKLRQSTDILQTVRCVLPATAMGVLVPSPGMRTPVTATAAIGKTRQMLNRIKNEGKNKSWQRNARMRHLKPPTSKAAPATINDDSKEENIDELHDNESNDDNDDDDNIDTTSMNPKLKLNIQHSTTQKSNNFQQQQQNVDTPRVRIWLELGGPNGSGSVEVGVATTLTVRTIVPGTIGVRVVDCAALDGLGDSMQQLLDERGCPIDEQVMPALHTSFKPVEEGWSKIQEEDLIERTFTATFPAFKFPDRERLHISCGVQLCKGNCPNLKCRTTEQLNLSGDKNLARIEVFNSLAVTAPQIEVDHLRYDRHYNMSEEYGPKLRQLSGEGTLCLSISKLAISFCILGLIFLIAVIVAISSLIRTRRQNCARRRGGCGPGSGSTTNSSSRIHRAEVCTSMFSSSSESAQSAARFGSKLFIPYYQNTLPYGRVY